MRLYTTLFELPPLDVMNVNRVNLVLVTRLILRVAYFGPEEHTGAGSDLYQIQRYDSRWRNGRVCQKSFTSFAHMACVFAPLQKSSRCNASNILSEYFLRKNK